MKQFIAIIDYDEGENVCGAWFPDAPGCTAMGSTEDEVIDNAIDALSEWASDELAEARTLPEPRTYLQLLKAREYGLGSGGMVARIPLVFETGRVIRANISIDEGLLASIDEAARRQKISRSAFLAAAARQRIRHTA